MDELITGSKIKTDRPYKIQVEPPIYNNQYFSLEANRASSAK